MRAEVHPATLAAANNARWCSAMCRAHGVADRIDQQLWSSPVRTPPLYPDAVTLRPGCAADAVVERIDRAAPGASVKDSFADLDLSAYGLRVLFEAQWIALSSQTDGIAPRHDWVVVDDPQRLRAWAQAWDGDGGHADLFTPALLVDPTTTVVAGRGAGGDIRCGAVLTAAAGVVGVSNVFGLDGPDAVWSDVPGVVARLFPAVDVVGYEQGEDLAAARRHGWRPLGPLRVWLAD